MPATSLQLDRYLQPGPSVWSFDRLPHGTSVEHIALVAEDRGESLGALYRRGGERTVVCIMHPRSDHSRHYSIPALVEAGYAAFGQTGRWANNDIGMIHEMLLVDVAAGLREMKRRGFENIVLLGSGAGGALSAFYQSQAATAAPRRLEDTAAGDPFDLNGFDLPAADGVVELAAHLGEGMLMLACIDPSVVQEGDPLSIDPQLDMFHPRNGFREPPQSSTYSGEFIARYRAAQRGRVARLDAIARNYISMQRHFQEEMRDEHFEGLALEQREFLWRRALVARFIVVNRTEANPAYCDLSLYPSLRDYGSFSTPRPDVFNYSDAGFGRYQTPRAWLSTWSGLSSRAATLPCIAKVACPTLVLCYTSDNLVFVPDVEAIHEASGAADKEMHFVDGDHLGLPPACKPNAGGRDEAMKIVVRWLRQRFPAA